MNKIIDGNKTAKEIKDKLKEKTAKLERKPALAVVIVGDNQASRTYVNHKKKDCEYVGFDSIEHALPKETTQEELLALINSLNEDPAITGILC